MADSIKTGPSRRPHSIRQLMFRIAAMGLALSLGLGAFELAARIAEWVADKPESRSAFLSKWPRKLYTRDNLLGKVQRPNVTVTTIDESGTEIEFTTDSNGLRIGTGVGHKSSGRTIAVLGDSFIQGAKTPFELTFCEILSERLGGRTVHNFGIGGYSTQQAVDLGKRIAPKLNIDTVVLGVFVGNDLKDNLEWTGRRVPVEVAPKSRLDHSAFYRLIRDRAATEDRTVFKDYDWRNFFDAELLLYDPSLSADAAAKLELAKSKSLASLQQFAQLASQLAARPLVVLIPTKAMVYEEPLFITSTTLTPWSWDAMMGVAQRGYDFDRVRAIWSTLAEQAELPFLDLTDAFRAARNHALYGKIDRHWSHIGQRIAAEQVAHILGR